MQKKLNYAVYRDRILGGWIGKSLGGIIGAPYECHKQFTAVSTDKLWPSTLYPNDDLDIQVVWLEALQTLGPELTSRQLAEFWHDHCFYTMCEYGVFIDNLEHGLYPPLSGQFNNDFFGHSEGCPIRSEIWGFICPGNPELAMAYAAKDGSLDHLQTSIDLEQFLAAAASLAFFYDDPRSLLDECCRIIPESNVGHRLYQEVKQLCAQYTDEYRLWLQLVRLYGNSDSTNALINNAFAFMALLKGNNDFREIMRLCVQTGWDVDCSCATAGALWGALKGSQALPSDWQQKMGKSLICACEIPHKNALLTDFATDTAAIGLEIAQSLNKSIEILDSPAVPVRLAPSPRPEFNFFYEDNIPVLWQNRATEITLNITNPSSEALTGELTVVPPAFCTVEKTQTAVSVLPGETTTLAFRVKLQDNPERMPGKALFEVILHGANGTCLRDHFGLFCSVCWNVYGPYWDMWDKDQYQVCPYNNKECIINPECVEIYSSDAVNCHVRMHHAYLDENKLLTQEIPEEYPFSVEKATEHFSRSDLYAFNGASCCYLTREFQSESRVEDVSLWFHANCPCQVWLDGKLIKKIDIHTKCNSLYGRYPKVTLTGAPQRLVVKLASRLEDFSFYLEFYKTAPGFERASSPYFHPDILLKNNNRSTE